jgi:fatty acid amide hydrolase 2
MRDAVARATAALAARGATVVELDDITWRRLFGKSIGAWMRGLASAGEGQTFAETLSGGARIPVLAELVNIARGKPNYAFPTLALVLMERLQGPFNKRLGGAPTVDELRAGFDEVLGDRGVIIHPPFSRPAPRHIWPLLTPFDAVCTALFSVAGMPGTAVPVGFDERHLPVGVQVVGRRGDDRLTLAAARALEDAFGGWVPAPTYSNGSRRY